MPSDEKSDLLVAAIINGLAKGAKQVLASPAWKYAAEVEVYVRRYLEDNKIAYKGSGTTQMVYADFKKVKPDATIEVEGFDEPIDLIRLRRTVGNVAESLEVVRCYLAPNVDDHQEPRYPSARASAVNHLVRSLRTMETLAVLLKSDEVPSTFRDLKDEEPEEKEEK